MDNKEMTLVQNNTFPEYDDIRKAILEAREKVATGIIWSISSKRFGST